MWRGFDRKRIELILLDELGPFSKMLLDRTSDPTAEALSDIFLQRQNILIFVFCNIGVLTYLGASAKSLLAVSASKHCYREEPGESR